LDNIKKLFKKTTIYVVRCDSKDNLQDSAPCQSCIDTITSLNIKRIIYSSTNNTFISSNPENLVPSHISAGNKFLKKNKKTEEKSIIKKTEEKTKIKKSNSKENLNPNKQ
jgi:deoxycytidylate deaminase